MNLLRLAIQIRSEILAGANTAGRVGSWMLGVLDYIQTGENIGTLRAIANTINNENADWQNTALERVGNWMVLAMDVYYGDRFLYNNLKYRAVVMRDKIYWNSITPYDLGQWFVDYLLYINYEATPAIVIDRWDILINSSNDFESLSIPNVAIEAGNTYLMYRQDGALVGGNMTYDANNLTYNIQRTGLLTSFTRIYNKIYKNNNGNYVFMGAYPVSDFVRTRDFVTFAQLSSLLTVALSNTYNGLYNFAVTRNSSPTDRNGVWRSDENGENWIRVKPIEPVTVNVTSANGIVFCDNFQSGANVIYFSQNNGDSWNEVQLPGLTGNGIAQLRVSEYIDGYYYIVVNKGQDYIYRTDLLNWELLTTLRYNYGSVVAIIKDELNFHVVGGIYNGTTVSDVVTSNWSDLEYRDVPFNISNSDRPYGAMYDGSNWLIWGQYGNVSISHSVEI